MADLRVLIVADDPLVRAGLATLVGEQSGLAVVGRVSSLDDLHSALDLYRPDVCLWDAGWHAMSVLQRLGSLALAAPVAVLLSEAADARLAWAAGARGLLGRDAAPEPLASALSSVAQGLAVIDPAYAGSLLPRPGDAGADLAPDEAADALVEPLTPRELEVLRLVAEGMSNKAIAARLHISEHTVKFHVNAVLSKLGAESRTEAVVRATRLGLILL